MCVCVWFVHVCMDEREQCPTVYVCVCVYSASKRPGQSISRGLTALVREHISACCSTPCGPRVPGVVLLVNSNF